MRNENYWNLRLHKLCNRKCCGRTNRPSGKATRLVVFAVGDACKKKINIYMSLSQTKHICCFQSTNELVNPDLRFVSRIKMQVDAFSSKQNCQ